MLNLDFTQPPLYTAPTPVKRDFSGKNKPCLFLQNIEHISTFAHNNVAVDRNGVLWTWGCDTLVKRGKVFSYDFPPPINAIPCKRMERVIAVSAGGESTYCITSDGLLWGWGTNRQGRLGTGDTKPRQEPTVILDGVKAVHAGMDTTFCIRDDDSLWGWGDSNGGCPIPTARKGVQKPVYIMDHVIQASCNDDMAMAIKTDDTLWGWGECITNQYIATPVPLMERMSWQSVPSHGCGYAFAVTRSGDLYSFGISAYGSITPSQVRTNNSLPIKVLAEVEKVWAGHEVSMILMKNGNLFSSGNNGGGMCGIGKASAPFHQPAFVMQDVKEAAVGWYHAMALQNSGDLWIWGGGYSIPK